MANDKKFVVKNGLKAQNIEFVDNLDSAASTITAEMFGDGTLSFEGTSGQLFSISDTLTGTIFSVNDISGIPSIEVDDDGTIRFGEFAGNVLIGTDSDDGTNKVQVNGNVTATTFIGPLTGNASTASALQTARNIALSGAVTGNANFDGSGNITISTTATSDPTLTLAGDLTGSATFTNLGNATLTATIAANSVALGTDTTGNYAAAVSAGTGISVSGTAGEGTTFTVAHSDTSTQASVNNSNGTVIQDVTLDGFGHVTGLASVNLDGRYYTETEADSRFVNVAGDTMTGSLVIQGDLTVSGTTTTINTETIALADNIVVLNSNETAAPTQNAGIEIERGTSANVSLLWDEGNDRWTVGTDNFVAGTFIGNLTGNASTASSAAKWTTARTLSLSGDVTGSVSIDGSGNAAMVTTVANDSHTHDGRYYTETEADSRFVNVTGDTMTGDLIISKADAKARFYDATGTSGNNPFIEFDTTANQGIAIELNVYDGELPVSGYGLVVGPSTTNSQFPTTGTLTFNVLGEIYAGGTTLGSLNKVFHDGYHPNADKLTTARNIALTGAVTGNANFDGSGNISIATTATSDPTITLTGAVTGSGTMTNLGNVSITTTATADPTLTLTGDVTGSATFTNLGNATLTATVANDSHTHDGRYYTETETDTRFLRRDLSGGSIDVNAANGTQLFIGSTGTWTNRGPASDNSGALLSINTHPGNYYSQLWFDTGGRGIYHRKSSNALPTETWQRIFADDYHPNADKWTTARTLTLSGDVTGSVSWDGSANATITTAVAANSVALGTDTTGNYAAAVAAGNAITVSGSAGEGTTFTVNHADTSSQASVNNSNGTVIQDITLDAYGHITGLGSIDLDSRFVNVTGDTMTGALTVNSTITATGNIYSRNGDNSDIVIGEHPSYTAYGGVWLDGDAHYRLLADPSAGHTYLNAIGSGHIYFRNDNATLVEIPDTGGLLIGGNTAFHDGYHPNADKWTTARTLSLTGAVTGSVSIDGSGNVSLATTATSDPTLTLTGDVTGSATFTNLGNATLTATVADDSHSHSNYVVKTGDTMTGQLTMQSNILIDQNGNNGNIAYEVSGGCYIPRPLGGSFKTTSSSFTGAVAIKLPTASSGQSDMLSFWVDIFDYAGGTEGESISVYVYGYQYSTANWVNTGATIVSDRTDRDYTVRFGHDGTRPVVYIGETTSTWSYPQVTVRDFQAGYSASYANYDNAFAVTFETTLSGVVRTSQYNYPVAKQLQVARNIALTGAVTGNANFDGSGNISITTTATSDPTLTINGDASGSATFTNLGNATLTLTIADDSHNHVISNVDGLQTALDAKLNSSSYTAADVLTKVKTVDGSGSGLDADLLDGQHGSYYYSPANPPPSGGIQFTKKTTTYTASADEGIIADTTGGSWTLTLPASPAAGDQVIVADGGSWAVNNLTVARNGQTIESVADNYLLDVSGSQVQFIYDGTTWQVYSNPGVVHSTDSLTIYNSSGVALKTIYSA